MPIDPAAKEQATRSLHRSSGSFELVLAPVVLAMLGLWLDRTLGTVPLFTVIAAVLGFSGAAVSTYFQYNHRMAQHRIARPGPASPRVAHPTVGSRRNGAAHDRGIRP